MRTRPCIVNHAAPPTYWIPNSLELPDEELPEWLLLLPAGERIVGRDGRTFASPGAEAMRAAQAGHPDLPVDINHAELWQAPFGLESPAQGWVREYRVRGGALWGRVEWNAAGEAAIRSRSYRYYSPVYVPASDGVAQRLHSVALTNSPNLDVPALTNRREVTAMNAQILAALGLQPNASTEQVLEAIASLRRAAPETEMVPKADYDLMAQRATAAERRIADRDEQELAAEAAREVDAATRAGKIAPASRDYYLANCATREGIDAFKAFAAAAPAQVPGGRQVPPGEPQRRDDGDTPTPEEREVDRQLGGWDDDAGDAGDGREE